MTITEVSVKCNISADTLRYYEKIGLLPPIKRNSRGNREYTELDCKWINFIKCMKNTGLSIENLIQYVTLYQQGSETTDQRKELLIEQRQSLVGKIEELQNMLAYLNLKINNYENNTLTFKEKLKSL
ncbi:MerR family transcriptional regulator [Turicibacter sp. TJ11]|uniref:MerR family transcriptional regulator n=1 Tax=Turicibacter sp. TJ11 TaxID=2806443 RepID=UPI001F45F349|nr:MerR family transcriptional regulator [Turicibacter sp. TJ11]